MKDRLCELQISGHTKYYFCICDTSYQHQQALQHSIFEGNKNGSPSFLRCSVQKVLPASSYAFSWIPTSWEEKHAT